MVFENGKKHGGHYLLAQLQKRRKSIITFEGRQPDTIANHWKVCGIDSCDPILRKKMNKWAKNYIITTQQMEKHPKKKKKAIAVEVIYYYIDTPW